MQWVRAGARNKRPDLNKPSVCQIVKLFQYLPADTELVNRLITGMIHSSKLPTALYRKIRTRFYEQKSSCLTDLARVGSPGRRMVPASILNWLL